VAILALKVIAESFSLATTRELIIDLERLECLCGLTLFGSRE